MAQSRRSKTKPLNTPKGLTHNSLSDLSLDELDRLKKILEIQDMQKPWWKKPNYSVNGAIAACSIAIMFLTGWFQAQTQKLDNLKFMLEQKQLPVYQTLAEKDAEIDRLKASLADAKAKAAPLSYPKLVQLKTLAVGNQVPLVNLKSTLADWSISKASNPPKKSTKQSISLKVTPDLSIFAKQSMLLETKRLLSDKEIWRPAHPELFKSIRGLSSQ